MALIAQDDFSVSVPSGWGTADVGGAWAQAGGFPTSVNSGLGLLGPVNSGTLRQTQYLTATSTLQTTAQVDVSGDIGVGLGQNLIVRLVARMVDINNFYYVEIQCRDAAGGNTRARIFKRVNNVSTLLPSGNGPGMFPYTAGETFRIELVVSATATPTTIQARVYRAGVDIVPAFTTSTDSEAVLQSGGWVGVEGGRQGANSPVWRFDNYSADSTTAGTPILLTSLASVQSTATGIFTVPVTLDVISRARSRASGSIDIGGPQMFARDRFGDRGTLPDGWGVAEIGGTWALDLSGVEPPPPPPPPTGGIVGYGANATGGDGGTVLHVTTLADSGAGSLRTACMTALPRTIVFDIAGTIVLLSDIDMVTGNCTIDGSSAPGFLAIKGGAVCIRGGTNYVIKHLRVRPGDVVGSPEDQDGMTINGRTAPVRTVLIDHCSLSWAPDIGGPAIMGDVQDVTVQNCILGPGLRLSAHTGGIEPQGHAYGANVAFIAPGDPWVKRLTFWRNLFLGTRARNPRIVAGENVDVINNVMYNWGQDSAAGNPHSANIVANYYRTGPDVQSLRGWRPQTDADYPLSAASDDTVWVDQNVGDGWIWVADWSAWPAQQSASVRGTLSVIPQNASQAYAAVLTNVGAQPRDVVDAEFLTHVDLGTSTVYNGDGHPAPNPYWPY